MSKWKPLLIITLLFFTYATKLFAQETTSDIVGQVLNGKDPVAGATVTILNVPTNTKFVTTTRKDGRYNVAGLRIGGPYVVTITNVGFKEVKQENIFLTLGEDFTSDFTLIPESKELQEVVVSATRQNKVFNNSRTGEQEILNRSQIEQLPSINRSIEDFTKLEPTSNGLSFAGSNSGENNITVNGADFNNSFGLSSTLGGQANAQPIALDAIDQIQVNIAPYDVREGGFVGAGVNSVTRSGTNTFRGTAYTYIKGPGTQGYKVDDNVVAKTPFNYNVVGASLGGAFVKDKLFFFVNGEEDLQSAPATSVVASTASNPPVPGLVSQANADTLNALASFLEKNYGYNPGAYQGYSFKTNSYKINAKLDWNINPANVLTFTYDYLKSYADQFNSTSRSVGASGLVSGSNSQPGTYAMPFYGAGYRINNDLDVYMLELNTRFGNKASNKFQIGYTKERDFRTAQSASGVFPFVDIENNGNNYTSFGYEPFTYNNNLFMDSYLLTDAFILYKGSHELTFGTQDSYKKYQNAFAPGWNGLYQFSSLDAFLSGAPAENYAQEYSTLPGAAFPWAYAGATNLSLYAQDKWRATSNFTLTYGVRLDNTNYQNKFTDNPNFDNLTFKDGAKYNVGQAPESFIVVSPRVGFNWDVKHDRSLQIRGGAGIFEGAPPFVWLENQAANNGVQLGSFTTHNVPFYPTGQQGLNNYIAGLPAGQTQTSTPLGYSVDVTDKHFKYPTKLRASLGVDKTLGDGWVVSADFTYSKDIHATYVYNANLNESNAFELNSGSTTGGDQRLRYVTPTNANSNKYYYAGTSLQNPNLGTVIVLANTSKGYSYSAVAKLQKTWRNLSVSVAYAYNQTMTAMETGSTASSLWSARPVSNTDPNAATLAHPSWYQPNRVIAYGNYKIPEGKHLATTIGAVFEVAPAGVTSYVYNGDLNGDGNTGNDLIFIPRTQKDIALVDVGSVGTAANQSPTGETGGVFTGKNIDPRTSTQIWNQLNDFINQDHYLSQHRGQYAKSNSIIEPYFKHLDLHINQDIFFTTKNGTKHTLSLSMDMINVGNFISRNWGLEKYYSINNFLKFEGMSSDGKTPLFSFPYSDPTNQVPLTNSFTFNPAIGSRWQMMLGARYVFN